MSQPPPILNYHPKTRLPLLTPARLLRILALLLTLLTLTFLTYRSITPTHTISGYYDGLPSNR